MRSLPVVPVARPERFYVSLGDSMSIDAYAGGPGRGAASRFAAGLPSDFRLIPLARDGATSAQVRYVQIPQLKEMRIAPALVTLTMGGNDLLQTFGDPDFARPALDALRANADAILDDLRALCLPDTPILIGTIYDPSDGRSPEALGELMASLAGLRGWLAEFNATLRAEASAHGATLIDIHAAFQGHGAAVGDPGQSDPEPDDAALYYCGTIEPNAHGAAAIAALWKEAIESR